MLDIYQYYVIYIDDYDGRVHFSPHYTFKEAMKELNFRRDWCRVPAKVAKVVVDYDKEV